MLVLSKTQNNPSDRILESQPDSIALTWQIIMAMLVSPVEGARGRSFKLTYQSQSWLLDATTKHRQRI